MGLDVGLLTTNQEDLYQEDYDYFYDHSLSRAFCNFMLRQHTVEAHEEPELEQIGRLTQVDISPLYAMETYPEETELGCRLAIAANEEERYAILHEMETRRQNLEGNLETVRVTVQALIHQLSLLPDLADLLSSQWARHAYFRDFVHNTGDGYIDNNLGQDLRNFKCFLDYAKEHGSTTVYFSYG
ncbi:hypothetical protein [Hymenobacter profundi]|uniref:Uncharacterized protein n=1 Tax=Hymenobacter profundi TaxID=1982110 RepID=A0ABS6X0S0_9BACT|nr:hypothetical protein [Hymenobacter profundi]MBW3129426.1 hypothetical protein [Hymenobacter profundi]